VVTNWPKKCISCLWTYIIILLGLLLGINVLCKCGGFFFGGVSTLSILSMDFLIMNDNNQHTTKWKSSLDQLYDSVYLFPLLCKSHFRSCLLFSVLIRYQTHQLFHFPPLPSPFSLVLVDRLLPTKYIHVSSVSPLENVNGSNSTILYTVHGTTVSIDIH
jgi:hypothetical protein